MKVGTTRVCCARAHAIQWGILILHGVALSREGEGGWCSAQHVGRAVPEFAQLMRLLITFLRAVAIQRSLHRSRVRSPWDPILNAGCWCSDASVTAICPPHGGMSVPAIARTVCTAQCCIRAPKISLRHSRASCVSAYCISCALHVHTRDPGARHVGTCATKAEPRAHLVRSPCVLPSPDGV